MFVVIRHYTLYGIMFICTTVTRHHVYMAYLYYCPPSRGIGLGLVKRFLLRDNTVVATTRKPAEAEALHQLAQQQGKGKLLIKLLDTSCETSVTAWAAALAKEVSHVDVSAPVDAGDVRDVCVQGHPCVWTGVDV